MFKNLINSILRITAVMAVYLISIPVPEAEMLSPPIDVTIQTSPDLISKGEKAKTRLTVKAGEDLYSLRVLIDAYEGVSLPGGTIDDRIMQIRAGQTRDYAFEVELLVDGPGYVAVMITTESASGKRKMTRAIRYGDARDAGDAAVTGVQSPQSGGLILMPAERKAR